MGIAYMNSILYTEEENIAYHMLNLKPEADFLCMEDPPILTISILHQKVFYEQLSSIREQYLILQSLLYDRII